MLSQDFVVGYGGRGLLRNNNAPRVPAAHLATEEARTPFCTDVHCYLYSRPNLYRDRERLLINALLSLNEGQRRFLLNSPAVPAPRPSPRGSSDFTVARDCASVYFTSPPCLAIVLGRVMENGSLVFREAIGRVVRRIAGRYRFSLLL